MAMPIENRQLAVVHHPDSLELLTSDGRNSDVFTVETQGQVFVIKEVKVDSRDYQNLGFTPFELAVFQNNIFHIAKKYYGTCLLNSYYLIANDRIGQPTIVSVQPKIEGQTLGQVIHNPTCSEDLALMCWQRVREFEQKWEEVRRDPQWETLPHDIQEYYDAADFTIRNIMLTLEGEFVIIDF